MYPALHGMHTKNEVDARCDLPYPCPLHRPLHIPHTHGTPPTDRLLDKFDRLDPLHEFDSLINCKT